MAEISQKLQCSSHKVSYWLHKLNIPRRSLSEAMYRKLNPDGDPFLIKKISSIEDSRLLGLGLGIYWGEGNKVSKHAIRVANSDPKIILAFIKFLTVICSIKKEKIKFSIVSFNDSNIEDVTTYWSKVLEVSSEKFGKIVQIPPQGKGIYKRKSQFGVCTVSVHNMKLKQWLMNSLAEF